MPCVTGLGPPNRLDNTAAQSDAASRGLANVLDIGFCCRLRPRRLDLDEDRLTAVQSGVGAGSERVETTIPSLHACGLET
jgi:hypothetical protein